MDISEAVKIARPAIKSHYSVSTFGGVGPKYHRPYHNQVCHASGRSGWSKNIEFYYTSVASEHTHTSRGKDKLIKFTEWLLCDTSPWAKLVKGRQHEIIIEGNNVGYVLEVKPEDDLRLLMSVSMGGRIPQERRPNWELMMDLDDLGVGFDDSTYIAEFFTNSNGRLAKADYINWNHSVVSPRFSLKKFIESDPNVGTKSMSVGGGSIAYDYGKGLDAFGRGLMNNTFSGTKAPEITPLVDCVTKSGSINGRWVKRQGAYDIDSLMKVWTGGYRSELLEACARAA